MAVRPASRSFIATVRRATASQDAARLPQQQLSARARALHAVSRSSPLLPTSASRRPGLGPLSQPRAAPVPQAKRTIFIQTEDTPNADALKFKPNHRILPENFGVPFLEYLSPRSTLAPPYPSSLAAQLLSVDGVTSIFFGQDYITVTKDPSHLWAHVKPEVFALITEAITSGTPIVTTSNASSDGASGSSVAPVERDSLAYDESDSEVVSMIKELLETRIRPAIQEDGGDIEFRGFDEADGLVKLKLRGACRTCDSSTVTLKNGIESMLQHYIQEVQGVQQVLDEEEEVALKEFERFEQKLKSQRGHVPPTGPIDSVA